jgi:hypothetical protein
VNAAACANGANATAAPKTNDNLIAMFLSSKFDALRTVALPEQGSPNPMRAPNVMARGHQNITPRAIGKAMWREHY